MSILEDTLGQNYNTLGRRCLSNGQGTPPGSSRGIGGSYWGEEYLGLRQGPP